MNAKQFWKLNPNFKFNRIFLYNQSQFNNFGNIKKYLFPLNKANYNYNNKYITELTEDKNLDYLTQNLISEFKNENDKINKKNEILNSSPNKNNDIKIIRSKILKNNNKLLKQIDFNINNTSDKLNNSFELNINHYLSNRKFKNKNVLSEINKNNKRTINFSEENINIKNKMDNLMNKSHKIGKSESEKLKLPYITTHLNIRNYNLLSFNNIMKYPKNRNHKKINTNNKTSIESIESSEMNNNIEDNDKNINNKDKNEMQRDIFKNINYFLDNKKSQLNVKDIQRNINDMKNSKEENEQIDDNIKSKIFINTKISNLKPFRKKNLNNEGDLLNDEEILKRKEKEKYMIYEKNKKYIEKKKIYNAMKYGAAGIPNLALDKGFRDIKKFEYNVLNLKNTQLDLPVFIKTNSIY